MNNLFIILKVSTFHFKRFNGGVSNFLHQKQIIQKANNLFIIVNVSAFHFKWFNRGASNFLHYKQNIQEANNLFIIFNVSYFGGGGTAQLRIIKP
jgi:hypothetical protein